MKRKLISGLLLVCGHLLFAQVQKVSINVKSGTDAGDLRPFWAYFGYDEPNYTTRPHGKKLLRELQQLSSVPVYVRVHNLLTSKGNSPGPDLKWGFTDAYRENASGQPEYNWMVVDSIIDTFVQLGMKPLMEIGFMPKDLSVKPEPYEHYWNKGGDLWTGWTAPPKDYDKWRELVYQWVKHSIERYGKKEVESWLWEVWNEPDIAYWSGTFEEYCKLYDYAADGLKKACPDCVIGGPHTTSPRGEKGCRYLTRFIEHCLEGTNYAIGQKGSPLQYIGFHAKGAPEFINGQIRMNMGAQLKDIQRGFEAINSFPQLKNIPVIIGECDPEGCAACSAKRDPKYGYRNGTMYSSYTAASFARIYELKDKYGINLQGAVSWSFEFEDQEWFAGFRDLATNGVDKPVLNIFRMLGMMNGRQVRVLTGNGLDAAGIIEKGVRKQNDVNALASKDGNSVWVMVWNYHDDELNKASSEIDLQIDALAGKRVLVHHYRVDQHFSNAFEYWKQTGSPARPDPLQYNVLEKAGSLQLYQSPEWKNVENQSVRVNFTLPAQGVSLLQFTW